MDLRPPGELQARLRYIAKPHRKRIVERKGGGCSSVGRVLRRREEALGLFSSTA